MVITSGDIIQDRSGRIMLEKSAPSDNKTVRVEVGTESTVDKSEIPQKVTFVNFTQGTTFHGVHYIFKPGSPYARKFTWMVAVIAAIAIFSYQVISRFRDYYDYSSNVNVEVIHTNEGLAFPSVTICNQNNFRIYETVNYGMENTIYTRYSRFDTADTSTGKPQKALNSPFRTYKDFATNVSHQMENMLHGCYFSKAVCRAEDFVKTVTDFGVCYTFNSSKVVLDAGAQQGLSLVMNIEKYEHMPGPHNDIGLKVLLHDPSDFPMMLNHGITLAGGFHALIAAKMTKTESLSAPFGFCVDDAPPRSHCLLQCEADKMMQSCGCHDIYIPESLNASYCDLGTGIFCVFETSGSRACDCSTPCKTTSYQADISYADISSTYVTDLWGAAQERANRAVKNYQTATELLHRVNPYLSASTIDSYQQLDAMFWEIDHMAKDIISTITTEFPAGNISTLDAIIAQDLNWIFDEYERKHHFLLASRHNNITTDLQYIYQTLYGLLDIDYDSFNVQYSTLVMLFDRCDITRPASLPSLNTNSRDELLKIKTKSLKWKDIYLEITIHLYSIIFPFMSEEDIITKQTQCLDFIQQLQNDTSEQINVLITLIDDYGRADECSAMKNISLRLYDEFLNLVNDAGLSDLCYRHDLQQDWSWKNDIVNTNPIEKIRSEATSLTKVIKKSQSKLARPFLEYLADYNKTKAWLYNLVVSERFILDISELLTEVTTIDRELPKLGDQLPSYMRKFVESFPRVYSLPIPVISNTSWTTDLKLIKYLNKAFPNNSQLHIEAERFEQEGTDSIDSLNNILINVSAIYQGSITPGKITGKTLDIITKINDIKAKLSTFSNMEDAILDTKNFIKMDIFYEEMSYTRIRQFPAFSFISLLSEIGGFMGLLLGASALTVCELLDFLVIAALGKLKAPKVSTGGGDTI